MDYLILAVAVLTLVVTCFLLYFEHRSRKQKRRAAIAWRILDESMRVGYARKVDATVDGAWEWLERVAMFCRAALGYHAMRLILQDAPNRENVKQKQDELVVLVDQALLRIHVHIADKVVEDRTNPDFQEAKWQGWTPETPVPVQVELD